MMRHIRKICLVILIMVFVLQLTACSGKKNSDSVSSGDSRLKVITTIFASYDFVRQIAGDNVQLSMLLKPGAEAHSYEPTPQDIIAIQECDVFIYVGGENDAWIDNILESIDTDQIRTVKLLDCVDTKYYEETVEGMEVHDGHDHHSGEASDLEHDDYNENDVHDDTHEHDGDTHEDDEHEDDTHEHDEWDEHVWTSPANAMSICKALTDVLCEEDTDNESSYRAGCEEYQKELEKLDEYTREIVDNAAGSTIIFGDRFPVRYFIEEYGLSYYAAFPGCSQENEASAATIAFLIDKVKEQDIPVVFKIELSSGNMAETIAEDCGIKVETFYTGHNISKKEFDAGETYLSLMYHNADVLKEALN